MEAGRVSEEGKRDARRRGAGPAPPAPSRPPWRARARGDSCPLRSRRSSLQASREPVAARRTEKGTARERRRETAQAEETDAAPCFGAFVSAGWAAPRGISGREAASLELSLFTPVVRVPCNTPCRCSPISARAQAPDRGHAVRASRDRRTWGPAFGAVAVVNNGSSTPQRTGESREMQRRSRSQHGSYAHRHWCAEPAPRLPHRGTEACSFDCSCASARSGGCCGRRSASVRAVAVPSALEGVLRASTSREGGSLLANGENRSRRTI